MKWLELVRMILAPVLVLALRAKGVDPVVAQRITAKAVDAVGTVETIPGADGPTKRAAALKLVGDGFTEVNDVTGTHKIDPTEVVSLVGQGIDLGLASVKLVHAAHTDAVVAAAANNG